mgnify:FL=1
MARILKFVADFAYLQSVLHFIKVIKSIDQKFEINLDFCKLEIMYNLHSAILSDWMKN